VVARFYPERLTAEMEPNVKLWRARPHDAHEEVAPAAELGTTPVSKSRSNRMSPAGIPMFYCAFDERTATRRHVSLVGALTGFQHGGRPLL
jgi:hypothetical protein